MINLVGIVHNLYSMEDINCVEYTYGEIEVERNSGIFDTLKIRYKTSDLDVTLLDGDYVLLKGNLRTYKQEEGKTPRTITIVYVRSAEVIDAEAYEEKKGTNEFSQEVTVLSIADRIRQTPSGARILDVSVLLPRKSGESDKVNCLIWGPAATAFKATIEPRQSIVLEGRLQSREYTKKVSEEESLCCVTYELSVKSWNTKED